MDFYGTKQNGKPVFPPAVGKQRRVCWNKIKDGDTFKSSLSIPRKSKSYSQVKLIWGNMIANTILQAEEKGIGVDDLLKYLLVGNIPKGAAIDEDFLHALMYVICPTTNEDGKKITLSKMNTLQASSLFKRFCDILAGIGIYIEEPDNLEATSK